MHLLCTSSAPPLHLSSSLCSSSAPPLLPSARLQPAAAILCTASAPPLQITLEQVQKPGATRHPPGLKYLLTELVCSAAGGPEGVTAVGFDPTKLGVQAEQWDAFMPLVRQAAAQVWPDSDVLGASLAALMEEQKPELCLGLVAQARGAPAPPKRLRPLLCIPPHLPTPASDHLSLLHPPSARPSTPPSTPLLARRPGHHRRRTQAAARRGTLTRDDDGRAARGRRRR